jgi:hypothetical protein
MERERCSSRMRINLHIERVVLDGLPVASHERGSVLVALEIELTRLLADGGLSPELVSGGAIQHVPASPIQLKDNAMPAGIGEQVAGAVHRAIGSEVAGVGSARRDNVKRP